MDKTYVYAEWFWGCDACGATCDEPCDQQEAIDAAAEHADNCPGEAAK